MEEGSYHTAQLKRIINKYITPHAAVFSSAKAKEIFVKFGITPAEFLRPFGEYGEYAGSAEYNPFPDINNSNNGKLIYILSLPLLNFIIFCSISIK